MNQNLGKTEFVEYNNNAISFHITLLSKMVWWPSTKEVVIMRRDEIQIHVLIVDYFYKVVPIV